MKNIGFLIYFVIVFLLLIVPFYSLLPTPYSLVPPVLAFESTSTSFEIHAAALESTSGSSTSASFKLHNAGGQTGTGTSTAASEKVYSGILYWLHGLFTPQYEQIHFRWRNDDGSEVGATWPLGEDVTYSSFPKITTKRLRFEITNSGWTRGAAPTFQLQYATSTDCVTGNYTTVPTDTSFAWQVVDSANLTDYTISSTAGTTTNVSLGLMDANNTFVAGQVKDIGNTTGAIALASNNFTEIEYALQATSNAVTSATYCFQLLDSNLTPTKMLYTRYAKAVIAGYASSGNVISSTYDTGVSSGAAYNSIIWQGTKPFGTMVRFQFATSNCANGGNDYPACTGAWGSGANGSDYIGGATCASNDYYTPAPNTPATIGCVTAAYNHKNKRYFRYQVQLCSSIDCATQGTNTPQVDEVDVNWSP